MKKTSLIACIAVSSASLTLGVAMLPLRATAQAPSGAAAPAAAPSTAKPSASGSAASASASAAPTALPASTFDLAPLAQTPWSDVETDPPSAEEWKTAPFVEITRRAPAARDCTIRRVREYVRVRCTVRSAGARVLAGNPRDVVVQLGAPAAGNHEPLPESIEVTFPIRRNDPHLIRLFGVEFGYEGGVFAIAGSLLDASWPESAKAPTLVIR